MNLIEKGEKVHIVYRATYEGSARMQFIGDVEAVSGSICRIKGYLYTFHQLTGSFSRKPEIRVTVVDLAESGTVVNIIDRSVVPQDIVYEVIDGEGLTIHDGKNFSLNISEFATTN